MKAYQHMTKEELLTLKKELEAQFEDVKSRKLSLDMSRGKPGADQLALSMGMLDVLNSSSDMKDDAGVDARNYGLVDGLPEAKKLLADMVGTERQLKHHVRYNIPFHDPRRNGRNALVQAG